MLIHIIICKKSEFIQTTREENQAGLANVPYKSQNTTEQGFIKKKNHENNCLI